MDSGTQLLADIEKEMLRTRQRVFSLVAGIVIPPTMVYMAIADFAQGDDLEAWAKLAAGATMAISAVIQYRPAFAGFAPRLSMLVCIVPLIIAVFGSRGHQALLWHALFPVLCTFLFGRWEGLIWSGLMFVLTLPIVLFHGWLGLTHLEGFEPDYLAVYTCLALLAFGWENQGARMRRELARERDTLADARRKQAGYAATASDWFFELDANGKMEELTGNWEDSIGVPTSRIVGKSLLQDTVLPPGTDALEDPLLLAIRAQEPFRNVHRTMQLRGGGQVHLQVSAMPLFDAAGSLTGWRGSGTDITAQIEAEQEISKQQAALRRSERMNAIGQLTSGIAHDFNNVLALIKGSLELMSLDPDRSERDREMLGTANRAAQTAADLISTLLTFARQQSLSSTVVNPFALFDALRALLPLSVSGQKLEISCDPGTWDCRVDRSQLESALINLVVNARDAIEGTGYIRLVAGNVQLRRGEIPAAAANQMDQIPEHGHFVCMEVSDTGCGMEEEMIAEAFEPFFTTKDRDQGTGLGLSMVHGFTYQSGGFLDVQSTRGSGTSIALYLPAEAAKSGEAMDCAALPERILLVTGDDHLAEGLPIMLERLGCQVTLISDPAALHGQQELPQPDVVLYTGTDDTLAADLLEHGVIAAPEQLIKVLSMSERGDDDTADDVLTRPFGLEELRRTLLSRSWPSSQGVVSAA